MIDQQAAQVEIDGPAHRQVVIDHHGLGMRHEWQHAELHPGRRQVAHGARADEVGEPVIRLARNRDGDLHTAPCCQPQRIAQAVAGHKIGRDGQDALLGAKAGIDQQRLGRIFALVGAAGEKLRKTSCFGQFVVFRADRTRFGTAHRGPVVVELACRCRCHLAAQVERQVAPWHGVGAVAGEVFTSQVATARPQPAIVGNGQFAVVAQVARAVAAQAEEGAKHRCLATSRTQHVEMAARQSQRAKAVEQHSDADSLTCPARQPVDDFVSERVVADNERADVDARARALDHFPQRIAGGCTIGMKAHGAAAGGGQAEALDQLGSPVARWRGVRRTRRTDRAQLAAPEHQVHRQHHVGHERQAHDPGDGGGGCALLAAQSRGEHVGQHGQRADQEVLRERGQPAGEGVEHQAPSVTRLASPRKSMWE